MDCRRFHRSLEDYLEDGLDFPGRFGMERHAQQCISCGKDLSNAQRLQRMVRELDRVKAPANFESVVLHEIGKRKANTRFSGLRRFWIYGFEFPSTRRLALASSCLAVLAIGIFYVYPYIIHRTTPKPFSAPPVVAQEPAKIDKVEKKVELSPTIMTSVAAPVRPTPTEKPELSAVKRVTQLHAVKPEQIADQEIIESDYLELQWIGPDNRPVRFRYPNMPHIRYGQNPDEYFIRNVSH
jgi:hypothetical protein